MVQKYSYNRNSDKTIWFDLNKSSQVQFFTPIISLLSAEGYKIKISIRNYSQIVELAKLNDLTFTSFGAYHDNNNSKNVIRLFNRVIKLIHFAIDNKVTAAISYGSKSQMIVASLLKIPIILFLDDASYKPIPYVKPKIIFLPKNVRSNNLKANDSHIIAYPGKKEDIYIPGFKPKGSLIKTLGIDKSKIVVVLRPPFNYLQNHISRSSFFLNDIISHLVNLNSIITIILPRNDVQKKKISKKYAEYFNRNKLLIPDQTVNGMNLIWHADLVISGGGIMDQEAAALGVPVYSISKSKVSDDDKYMSNGDKLIIIENIEQFKQKVKFEKRYKQFRKKHLNSMVLHTTVNEISSFIKKITEPSIHNQLNTDDKKAISTERRFRIQ